MRQSKPGTVVSDATEATDAPLTNQTPFKHGVGLRQRMSFQPSPLKSPPPASCQVVSETVGKITTDVGVVPFMSQIEFWPLTMLCQIRSVLPSPSMSAAPAMRQ